MENTAAEETFCAEHGLSFLHGNEEAQNSFLMPGRRTRLQKMQKNWGIDLSQVDVAVLSHGHYDHGGGLLKFWS